MTNNFVVCLESWSCTYVGWFVYE